MAEREMTATESSVVRTWNFIWTGFRPEQMGDSPEQWSVTGTPEQAVAELNRRLRVSATLHRVVADGAEWDIRVRVAETGGLATAFTTL